MNLLSQIEKLRNISLVLERQLHHVLPENTPYVQEAILSAESIATRIEMWHEYGDKTFMLSPELVEAFQHTDIPMKAYPTEFRFPFGCFTVESEIPLFETMTGYIEVNGEKVGRNQPSPVHTIMYMSREFVEKTTGQKVFMRPDGTRAEALEWDHSVIAYFPGEGGLGLETITANIRNDMTIEDSCHRKKEGLLISELEEVDGRNLMNIFMNTMMYVNDPTRRVIETEEQRRRKVKLRGRKKAVKMGYIYLKPPSVYVPLSRGSEGSPLEKRFIVRGHYRNQVYGAERALRKLIWIQPHWKGPEWGERMSRPYKVT